VICGIVSSLFLVCDAIGHVLEGVLVREAEIVMQQQRDILRDA